MSKLGGEGAATALLKENEAREGGSEISSENHRSSFTQSPKYQSPEPIRQDSDGKLGSVFWTSLSGEVSLPGTLL